MSLLEAGLERCHCRTSFRLAGKFFQDDFPRIVDDIPRRLPNINFPALQENLQGGVREFFLPSGLSYQVLTTNSGHQHLGPVS